MGLVWSYVKRHVWPQHAHTDLEAAINHLRLLRDSFERRRNRIAFNLQDPDREILELQQTIRARDPPKVLPEERAALNLYLGKRRMYIARIERFSNLLLKIEQQLVALEDSIALEETMRAMRRSVTITDRQHALLGDYQELLDTVEEQQQLTAEISDSLHSLGTVNSLSDDTLLEELDTIIAAEAIGKGLRKTSDQDVEPAESEPDMVQLHELVGPTPTQMTARHPGLAQQMEDCL